MIRIHSMCVNCDSNKHVGTQTEERNAMNIARNRRQYADDVESLKLKLNRKNIMIYTRVCSLRLTGCVMKFK